MLKTIATQLTACFISMALLTPTFVCATDISARKSQAEIKKLISAQETQGRKIQTSDLVTLSLLSAAVAGAGGAYAGALWQKAKTTSAKEILIKKLETKVSFLNQALQIEEREQGRLLRVLDEQGDLFAKMIKTTGNVAEKDLRKAELSGFNRGYDAAFRGAQELSEVYYERGYRMGYEQQATEELISTKNITYPKNGKISKTEAKAIISSLKEEISRLQGKLGTIKAMTGEDGKIVHLMSLANKKIGLLISSPRSEKTKLLEQEITAVINTLKKVSATGVKKEFIDNFANSILCRMKTRGGFISLAGIALFSAGMLAVSQRKDVASVSYTRLNIQRSVQNVYENNPELFATEILVLKEQYGADLVSSVLYENQHYMPLLEGQFKLITSPQLSEMLDCFKGRTSPAQNKQMLLSSIAEG